MSIEQEIALLFRSETQRTDEKHVPGFYDTQAEYLGVKPENYLEQ